MRKLLFFSGVIFIVSSCGPSQEELDRQQRIEDSLMEIERISIIEKANQQLLEDTVQTDSSAVETVEEKK